MHARDGTVMLLSLFLLYELSKVFLLMRSA